MKAYFWLLLAATMASLGRCEDYHSSPQVYIGHPLSSQGPLTVIAFPDMKSKKSSHQYRQPSDPGLTYQSLPPTSYLRHTPTTTIIRNPSSSSHQDESSRTYYKSPSVVYAPPPPSILELKPHSGALEIRAQTYDVKPPVQSSYDKHPPPPSYYKHSSSSIYGPEPSEKPSSYSKHSPSYAAYAPPPSSSQLPVYAEPQMTPPPSRYMFGKPMVQELDKQSSYGPFDKPSSYGPPPPQAGGHFPPRMSYTKISPSSYVRTYSNMYDRPEQGYEANPDPRVVYAPPPPRDEPERPVFKSQPKPSEYSHLPPRDDYEHESHGSRQPTYRQPAYAEAEVTPSTGVRLEGESMTKYNLVYLPVDVLKKLLKEAGYKKKK